MKERYQEIDDKNDSLREYLDVYKSKAKDFLERFEMSWIYHDAALEGVVYTPQELQVALHPQRGAAEASMVPVVLEIRNHKAVCDYIRDEAAGGGVPGPLRRSPPASPQPTSAVAAAASTRCSQRAPGRSNANVGWVM